MSVSSRLQQRIDDWALRRHGADSDPATISGRRIYILPTRLGLIYALAIFAMTLGAMNYGNNLALALAFILGSLAFVAMHHCHRNLAGLHISSATSAPVFAGQTAHFSIAIENPSPMARHEIATEGVEPVAAATPVSAGGRAVLQVEKPTMRRGWLKLERFEIVTRYPFGLFRAWAVLHMDNRCLVYPQPGPPGEPPPPFETDVGSAQDTQRGEEDFAGFRSFQVGDSPRRIAWKAYAREQGLLVKQYAGTAVTSHILDWNALAGLDVEARLSRLCRWILDAHAAGRAYGLKMPGVSIAPNLGAAHREHCLAALALFDSTLFNSDLSDASAQS